MLRRDNVSRVGAEGEEGPMGEGETAPALEEEIAT
jgi:hypothetical protein